MPNLDPPHVPLPTIIREWLRIGVTGFGGPPAHIALLHRLCVTDRGWLAEDEFEDGIAATNLLPGPASTQLAIYCAWRLRGAVGALAGGLCFILPGLVAILGLSVLLLHGHPARPVLGAAAGSGAAVCAVAVHAALGLVPASWRRIAISARLAGQRPANSARVARQRPGTDRWPRVRWLAYLAAGGAAAATLGPWLVLVLLGCGCVETAVTQRPHRLQRAPRAALPALAAPALLGSVWTAVAWVALKVGLLSFGGGFVIIPLMQADAVEHRHWMTDGQFLYAVALGQITPGPVVHTVAVVGYAAAGIGGALLAATVAFTPSFLFVLAGADRFDRLRANRGVQAFLAGAGPAAIGAIAGSAILLAAAIGHLWQVPVAMLAALWLLMPQRLLPIPRGVVSALLGAAVLGTVAAVAGLPVG
jgi:chromate transporter